MEAGGREDADTGKCNQSNRMQMVKLRTEWQMKESPGAWSLEDNPGG